MLDLTDVLIPVLRSHRIPGLDLGEDFIYPNYLGKSVLNLTSTLCHLLDVPGLGAGPLDGEILSHLGNGYQRVIFILMDALALHRFQRWTAEGVASAWKTLLPDGLLAPLTSITPSTTSAALTSLWTGRSTTEHAITGYEMWMKEYGVVANTITQAPITFSGDSGSLRRAGFDPANFLPFPTLGTHLAAYGVRTMAFQHYSISHSGLSQMYFKDVSVSAFSTASDLWINLRQSLESRLAEHLLCYVYWSEVDSLSHRYGADDERPAAEFASFGETLSRLFLTRLSPSARQGTLLVLSADHGQIATRPDPFYDFGQHPNLARRLHILPTGENRLAYFYIRPGQVEAVHEYLERTWPNTFRIVDTSYAIQSGLFGPGTIHPRLHERAGDFIVIARQDAYLWWAQKENHLHGRHGGLHPDEMLVPFFALPLG